MKFVCGRPLRHIFLKRPAASATAVGRRLAGGAGYRCGCKSVSPRVREQFESGKFADVLRAFLNIDGGILRAQRGFFWGRRGVIGFETQAAKSGGVAAATGARARRGSCDSSGAGKVQMVVNGEGMGVGIY